MRIHNIIKTVCLAGSLALLSACEDWLEIEPKDRFGDTTVWGSEENADMFLNDIYNQLPHLNNETQNLDQYSDNSYVGAEWMNARTTIYTGALSPTSWIPGPWDMWKWGRQNNDDAKGQYERIRSCNLFITKVTESDFSAEYKKERLAEVRFLRAWFYHYLWMASADENKRINPNTGEIAWSEADKDYLRRVMNYRKMLVTQKVGDSFGALYNETRYGAAVKEGHDGIAFDKNKADTSLYGGFSSAKVV